MRINQYLARCGVCSRRGADKLIESGIVLINGRPAQMGTSVSERDEIMVDGKPIKLPETTTVLAYYKPVGVTCSEKDEHAKRLVVDEIKSDKRLTYAGRLDRDSEGLLIMTDDGKLIDAMMRGANAHEKEYVVTVKQNLKNTDLERMSQGVFLKELNQKTRKCNITKINEHTFNIVLTQGLNRQIRRMCAEFGLDVVTLKRTRVMNITLGDLQVGASRTLLEGEKKCLYEACGLHI